MENYNKAVADLIDRYVYAVTKRLPQAQRADIEKELRGLIEDMLMSRTKGANPALFDAEMVLRELGKPSVLAAKYRGTEQHLIGPEYFDLYMLLMKLLVIVSSSAMALAQIIGFATSPPTNIPQAVASFFGSVISSAISAFAAVTLLFALIERYSGRKLKAKGPDWNPSDLPPVPSEKAVLKKSEPIADIVFAVIGIIIFNFAPWLFGAGDISSRTFIPVFNLTALTSLLPFIDLMFGITILKGTARLVIGKYDLRLAAAVTVLNIVYLITFIYVFAPAAIWNMNFMHSLYSVFGWGWTATAGAATAWDILRKVIVGLCIFGVAIDTITVIVRSFRHSDCGKYGKTA